MIFDSLSNITKYRQSIPVFSKVIDFLEQNDIGTLEQGKIEIDGDNLFAIYSEYNTSKDGPLNGNLEVHRKYIDLQIMIKGEEKVRYSLYDDLQIKQDYIEERDVEILRPMFDISEFYFKQGQFMMFFPEDAHEPGVAVNGVEIPVKKIVFKLSVSPFDLSKLRADIW